MHIWQTGIIPVTNLYTRSAYTFTFLSIFSDLKYHSSISLMSSLKGSSSAVIRGPVSCVISNPAGGPNLSPSHASRYNPSSCFSSASSSPEAGRREPEQQGENQSSSAQLGALGGSRQEVQDLKEQLETLRCQVGCSIQHSIERFSHFWCGESRTDVKSLLPGEDWLIA